MVPAPAPPEASSVDDIENVVDQENEDDELTEKAVAALDSKSKSHLQIPIQKAQRRSQSLDPPKRVGGGSGTAPAQQSSDTTPRSYQVATSVRVSSFLQR